MECQVGAPVRASSSSVGVIGPGRLLKNRSPLATVVDGLAQQIVSMGVAPAAFQAGPQRSDQPAAVMSFRAGTGRRAGPG